MLWWDGTRFVSSGCPEKSVEGGPGVGGSRLFENGEKRFRQGRIPEQPCMSA